MPAPKPCYPLAHRSHSRDQSLAHCSHTFGCRKRNGIQVHMHLSETYALVIEHGTRKQISKVGFAEGLGGRCSILTSLLDDSHLDLPTLQCNRVLRPSMTVAERCKDLQALWLFWSATQMSRVGLCWKATSKVYVWTTLDSNICSSAEPLMHSVE